MSAEDEPFRSHTDLFIVITAQEYCRSSNNKLALFISVCF